MVACLATRAVCSPSGLPIIRTINTLYAMVCRFIAVILAFCYTVFDVYGQVQEEPFMTWEDFVDEWFADGGTSEEDEPHRMEQFELLQGLVLHPLQLNLADREQLLSLPFLDEEQVDSLLSYRRRKHGFFSLGELQLVKGMDYYSRCYTSLFVRVDSAFPLTERQLSYRSGERRISQKLEAGRHEVVTRLDVPLYERAGYQKQDKPTASNYYFGSPLYHAVRYRYSYSNQVAYGLKMEKDAGEPVCKQGFYPYDYLSGYFYLHPKERRWSFVVGDYQLRGARGLLFGKQLYVSREYSARNTRFTPVGFRPHLGMDENNFFRGAAAGYRFGPWEAMAFISSRSLDARYDNQSDTVRSLLTGGLHRTYNEVLRRHNLANQTVGAHVGHSQAAWGIYADAYWTHFDHCVYPEVLPYNESYFRGRAGGAASLSHFWKGRAWIWQGEVAADNHWHWALEQSLAWKGSGTFKGQVQYRHFSSRFTSLYGAALQQGSRVANEQGLLLSGNSGLFRNAEWSGYVDLFRFPHPTFVSVRPGALGAEVSLQCRYTPNSVYGWLLRYRFKSRQRTVSGTQLMEYRSVHRARVAYLLNHSHWNTRLQADVSLATRQTGATSWGWMASVRTTWRPVSRFSFRAFAACFFTDDYESALYAYEPQLVHVASFPVFAYHGVRGVAVMDWRVSARLTAGLRWGGTRYFDRSSISTGPDRIASPWKNDLSVQLVWRSR